MSTCGSLDIPGCRDYSRADCGTDGHTDNLADRVAYGFADDLAYGFTDSHTNRDTDSYADWDTHGYTNSESDGYAERNTYGYAERNADCDTHTNAASPSAAMCRRRHPTRSFAGHIE